MDLTTDSPARPRRPDAIDEFSDDEAFDEGGPDHPDDARGPLSELSETFRSVRWLKKRGRSSLNYDDMLVDANELKRGLKRLHAQRAKRIAEGPKAKGRGRGRGKGRKGRGRGGRGKGRR